MLFSGSRANPPIAAGTIRGRVHADAGKASQDRFGVNARLSAGFLATCVCDGHGPCGGEVAQAAAREIMREVERQVSVQTPCGDAVTKAIKAAAKAVDTMPIAQTSGTTCAVALLVPKEGRLAVATVGDCEAIVVKAYGNVHDVDVLTAPHRTCDRKERERVEKAGGVVQAGYVIVSEEQRGSKQNSGAYTKSLNITRSLGDLDMRQYGIISEPSVKVAKVPQGDACLILGTDGLWGNVDEDEMPMHEWFGDAVAKYVKAPNTVIRRLFSMAGKPSDDATAVVMRLKE